MPAVVIVMMFIEKICNHFILLIQRTHIARVSLDCEAQAQSHSNIFSSCIASLPNTSQHGPVTRPDENAEITKTSISEHNHALKFGPGCPVSIIFW